MRECACGCGRFIPRRKERGHREREYYSDACRKRAWRARNKQKHDLDRIKREAEERMWNAIDQAVRRESWQDELALKDGMLDLMGKFQDMAEEKLKRAELDNQMLELEVTVLREQLAEKEAEIVRLTVLLEGSKKKSR